MNRSSTNGFHSLVWHLLSVLHEALTRDHASTSSTSTAPPLPPLEPLIWTPAATAERLLRPSHRLLALRTRFGFVSAGSPAEARNFSQGEAKYTPVAFVLPPPVFARPCGCEAEYPALLSEAPQPRQLAFIGSAAQLHALDVVLRETLVGPAREHCTEADIDFAAEHEAVVPESWPSHSLASLTRAYTLHPYSAETGAVELVLPDAEHEKEEGACGRLCVRCVHGFVRVYEDGVLVLAFDGDFQHLRHSRPHRMRLCRHCVPELQPPPPQWTPPPFAVTFLASTCACAACCRTVSLVVWAEGRGILVDPCSACHSVLVHSGLLPHIAAIVVTHAHVDPISGILPFYTVSQQQGQEHQQQQQQQRLPLFTTETVFGSLCRMVAAFVPLRDVVDFRPLRAGVATAFGGATLLCRYAMHTVPTLALEVDCLDHSIWYSAPSLYRPALYAALRRAGTLTRVREAELLHFGVRADIIIQGVGVAPVHTGVETVCALPASLRDKVVLVNYSRGQDVPGLRTALMRVAQYGLGGTLAPTLGEFREGYARGADVIGLVCTAPYLRSLATPDVTALLSSLVEQHYEEGCVVVDTSNFAGARARTRHLVFLVEAGTAALYNGDRALSFPTNVPMSELTRGDLFADTGSAPCRVVARTALRVLAFPERVLTHSHSTGDPLAADPLVAGLDVVPPPGTSLARLLGHTYRRDSPVMRALRYRSFLIQSFSQSSTFRSLTHEQIGVLASCVSGEIRLAHNERLIKQGDTADRSLFIVRHGTLGVFVARGDTGRRVEMARVGPGSCVGEMALIQGKPRSADVIAVTQASVLRLLPAEMDVVMVRYPQIRFILNAVITSRIDGLVTNDPFKAPRPRAPPAAPVVPACINAANRPAPVLSP